MIPAPPGLAARFKETAAATPYWHYRRVIGFDDDEGRALIVSENHRIEPADRFSNFDGFTDLTGDQRGDYTAIMPGGSWRVEFTYDDDSKEDMPLVGWALKEGAVVPLTADSEGYIDDLDAVSGKYRIYHPDATTAATQNGAPCPA